MSLRSSSEASIGSATYFAQLHEEKALLVEQLQRELAATVNELNAAQPPQPPAPVLGGGGVWGTANASGFRNSSTTSFAGPNMNVRGGGGGGGGGENQEGLVYDLLRSSQETAARLKVELDNARVEKEVCAQECKQLKQQNKRLMDDQEQLSYAKRDLEGKLQFRMNQILSLEQDRSKTSLKETELTERLSVLEKQNSALRSDLVASNTELRVAMARVTSLEMRLKEAKTEGEANSVPVQVHQNLQDELERVRTQSASQTTALQAQLAEVKRRYGEMSDKRVKELHAAHAVAHAASVAAAAPTGDASKSGTSTPTRQHHNYNNKEHNAPLSSAGLRAAVLRNAAKAVNAAATAAGIAAGEAPPPSLRGAPGSPKAATDSAFRPRTPSPLRTLFPAVNPDTTAAPGSGPSTGPVSRPLATQPARIPTPTSTGGGRYASTSTKEVLTSSDEEDNRGVGRKKSVATTETGDADSKASTVQGAKVASSKPAATAALRRTTVATAPSSSSTARRPTAISTASTPSTSKQSPHSTRSNSTTPPSSGGAKPRPSVAASTVPARKPSVAVATSKTPPLASSAAAAGRRKSTM